MGISALPAGPIWVAAMTAAAVLALWGAIPAGRGRPVRIVVLVRALLPVRILRSRSGQLDVASFLFSKMLAGTMIGWALVSGSWWATMTERATASLPVLPVRTPPLAAELVMTVALFVAYEGVYWLNHWLSHRIGWLWAFHKVHHTAESLSLLTNFRVHPVDTIVFYNMAAAVEGVTAGLLKHLMGPSAAEISVSGTNLLVFLTSIILNYLQHSHIWLATTGRWSRWILSPAHHQLHHSTDPRHHNRNLGSALALFDWLGGTLLEPEARRQPLRFGVDGQAHNPHGFHGAVLRPFGEAMRAVRRARRDHAPPVDAGARPPVNMPLWSSRAPL